MAESTGNHARVLSDLRTAHERLAISHEVWNRPMLSSIDDADREGRHPMSSARHNPATTPCARARLDRDRASRSTTRSPADAARA